MFGRDSAPAGGVTTKLWSINGTKGWPKWPETMSGPGALVMWSMFDVLVRSLEFGFGLTDLFIVDQS